MPNTASALFIFRGNRGFNSGAAGREVEKSSELDQPLATDSSGSSSVAGSAFVVDSSIEIDSSISSVSLPDADSSHQ
ncbi:hypothetical protein Nepgr_013352 [Nepenthes gracilis]|uniref:Uncharacterized protein n=1 Tax=Nepenthes gracilis TaxID=150966 RepID=A0AAD3SIT9_NEPGR|nr:hypothetical protein Nepgr_013352 [Nepenthes gracilis]